MVSRLSGGCPGMYLKPNFVLMPLKSWLTRYYKISKYIYQEFDNDTMILSSICILIACRKEDMWSRSASSNLWLSWHDSKIPNMMLSSICIPTACGNEEIIHRDSFLLSILILIVRISQIHAIVKAYNTTIQSSNIKTLATSNNVFCCPRLHR